MKKILLTLLALVIVACSPTNAQPTPDLPAFETAIAATQAVAFQATHQASLPSPTPRPTLTPTPLPRDVTIGMPKPQRFDCGNISSEWQGFPEARFTLENLAFLFWVENGFIKGETVYNGQKVGEVTSATQVPGQQNVWEITLGFSNVSHNGRIDNLTISLYLPVCGETLYTSGWQPTWPE